MNINIRKETKNDHEQVHSLIAEAFASEEMSDGQEQQLVDRLRISNSFIEELSLVAEMDNTIVGHILLTKINITNLNASHPSLALAPVSVLPEFQNKGIGSALIRKAHSIAYNLGYDSIILVGHDQYYPRFGYIQLDKFNIKLPFEVPPQNAMVHLLREGALDNVSGEVQYDPAFFE